MAITINGTTGLSGVDGSAGTPALQGSDPNTGISFGTDEVNINTGGSTRATVDSSGRLLVSSGDLRVTGTEGVSASLYLIADEGDDNGDGWRLNSNQDDNDLTISNNTTGSYVDQVGILTNGNFRFNSGYGSVATAYGCRAWVNFDGTGTVVIRASGNVSSITDDGTGSYTVNFTTAMPDANYCVSLSSDTNASGGLNAFSAGAPTTSGVPVYTYGIAGGGAGAYRDTSRVYVAIFR